jgi:4-hydroxy-2-oxoglutarate aldolase
VAQTEYKKRKVADLAQKSCVKLWKLCQAIGDVKIYQQAKELQDIISTADGLALKIGIPGMHAILHSMFGYGLNPRRPLMPMLMEKGEEMLASEQLKPLLDFENALRAVAL